MQVIGIASNDSDYTVAVLRRHEVLDQKFATEVRSLSGWERMDDDELLDAQTFVAWYRSKRDSKTIRDCLENETYAWGDAMELKEVPYQ